MVRVSTFCPRCGEAIETEVPDEARTTGRAELACPACRFDFVIAPAQRPAAEGGTTPPLARSQSPPSEPVRATGAERAAPADGGRPVSVRPLAAGLMLIFVAVIGLWMGSVLVFSDDLVESGFSGMEGDGIFAGIVVDPDGDPVEGVRVEMTTDADGDPIHPLDRPNATTGADGRYRFAGIDPGVHEFRFEKENHTTVLLEAPAYPSDYSPLFGDDATFGRVTLSPGDPDTITRESRIDDFELFARVWGWFTLVASLVALAGAWASLRRRGFALAVVGAVAGIFTFGFLIGSIVAFIALVLLLFSRKEFAPLRQRRDDPAGP